MYKYAETFYTNKGYKLAIVVFFIIFEKVHPIWEFRF